MNPPDPADEAMWHSIAVLEGDGIGPDVVRATVAILGRAAEQAGTSLKFEHLPVGLSALAEQGSTLPERTLQRLHAHPGWILGPVSHHVYSDPVAQPNPSGYLRTRFQLYANIRPFQTLPGVASLRSDVDVTVVREATEGFYADRNLFEGDGEFLPNPDLVLSLRVVSRAASLRIARSAFELARLRAGKRRVTAVHKANVLKRGDGLFLECCRQIAANYPDIKFDDMHADACALYLVTRPETFDVIVTTNMFGDILSDELAGIVGGLGLAPGINQGDEHAMAQATHGSAPEIAEKGIANPIAEVRSGQLLLQWIADRCADSELAVAARLVDEAVRKVLAEGRVRTPDLGGTATTVQMVDALYSAL